MKKRNCIDVEVFVGYDSDYSEQTEVGVLKGKELSKTICIPMKEARKIIQQVVYGLNYEEAREFAEKYEN